MSSARFFGLELGVVLGDEGADVAGHVEQLRPLLLVERDREAAEPVHGHAALLAHLERDPARRPCLERRVLGPESFELALLGVVSHGNTPYTAARTCSCTKRMMSWVEVPGPNSSLTPSALRAAMSSGGMMPPPNSTTSSAPLSRKRSSTRLNR